MIIEITVTKEILKRSMLCAGDDYKENCAIALAVRDIFPNASVSRRTIHPFGDTTTLFSPDEIALPMIATMFIMDFDALRDSPKKRLQLPEISFNVNVPDVVVDKIGISEITELISKSPTLQIA